MEGAFREIIETSTTLAGAGARGWSERLKTEPASQEGDPCIPADWKAAWIGPPCSPHLDHIGACNDLSELHRERLATEEELRSSFAKLVKERTFFNLAASMRERRKPRLMHLPNLFVGSVKGTGKGAVLHRHDARLAMEGCYDAVPCWIMPTAGV